MVVKKVMTPEEKQDAFAIRQAVFIGEQQIDPELEWDEHDKAADALMFVDYDSDGTPLATGRFRILPDYGKVERICTQRAARGKGAGRRIMEAIEAEALSQAVTQLRLGAQITAIPFYEKLGYTVCSDEFLDADIPHKEMKKELNP